MDWLLKGLRFTTPAVFSVMVLMVAGAPAFAQPGGSPIAPPPRHAPRLPLPGEQIGPFQSPTAPQAPTPEMAPTITILEPVNGSTVNSTTMRAIIAFGGLVAEPRTFRVSIDGADRTHLFTLTPSGASATIGPLSEGQHEVAVSMSDQVGRGATAVTRFTIDLKFGDLSPIEQAFTQAARRSAGGEFRLQDQQDVRQPVLRTQVLRQFGYDLFRTIPSTFAPVSDVPVGADYVLGPGDTLQVYMWGMVDNVLTLPVNQRGEVFLPKVGTIPVRGMTLGDARRLLHQQLSRQFSGFRLDLTLGELRSLQVYVVGEVARPGVYTVSSLSTVTNTLFAAGGPTKLGSLRHIQLIRQNRTIGTLDLYDFLLRGDRTHDFRVESGDTIFVPTLGPVVAVTGDVKRPGIYELKGPTRIHDFLQSMAGGVTPTGYLQRVQIERVKAHEEKVLLDFSLSALLAGREAKTEVHVEEGDLIKVFPIDTKVYNAVTLAGFVRRPGEYELKPGMRLSDLLRPVELLPEAYLERVEVIRTRPDFSREIFTIDLQRLWQGDRSQDLALAPDDHVVVSSEARPLGAVVLRGEVKRPGVYPIVQGERLSSVLKRAGGFTDEAYLRGALFIREQLRRRQQEELDRFIRTQEEALLQEAVRMSAGALDLATGAREEAALQQQTVQQRRQLLEVLRTKVVLGRLVVKVDEPERLEGTPNDIALEEGDSLMIPKQPSSVLVFGSVRNPTAVVYEQSKDVEYYLNRAGGVNKEADKDEIYVAKADGSAVAGFLRLRHIEPGDIIVVPPKLEAKVRTLPVVKDVATILGQFALTIGVLGALF
jgi:polysaccharide export outer membrane protein